MLNQSNVENFQTLYNDLVTEDVRETVVLLRTMVKDAVAADKAAWTARVAANKVAREEKKAKRLVAWEEAKAAKEEAKAKIAAAKAMVERKPRAKKTDGTAKRAKKAKTAVIETAEQMPDL